MDTSDLLLYGGIGVVLYYLFASPATAATAAAPATSTTAAPAVATAPTQQQVELAFLQVMSSAPILAAAKAGGALPASGLLTASQWNFYLTQVSGIAGTDVGLTDAPVSIDTYWAALIATATQAANNSVIKQAAASSGVAGLGSASQPGRGVSSNFPPPGNNVDGRYDFDELGWA